MPGFQQVIPNILKQYLKIYRSATASKCLRDCQDTYAITIVVSLSSLHCGLFACSLYEKQGAWDVFSNSKVCGR